ncbi:hypothetical protein N781_01915 [Pontibacillus halophilus JSM 076056 = DSM 19796]|uniref:Flagellar protein FliT n=1 Tax=Pontibacillus halophilus JSM 076056 = DSM 19796 TaxID=1385510 RepID=A0A0A5GLE4_9BACI|nr:flagellar protein FliT [Pontibacillus halophilus]KGX94096.1 hypothetical protein N781_01915 [Pontibacillus halophilus JSM 076056 = DSM 19796]
MTVLKQLHDLTSQLYTHVQEVPKVAERDDYIERLTDLLNERSTLLEKVEKPVTEEEKQYARNIQDMDKEIQSKNQLVLQLIKKDLLALKKQKSQKQSYTNPYQHLSNYDGMYLDKKK